MSSHHEIVEHIKTVCNLNNYKKEDCVKNIENIIKEIKSIKKYKNIYKVLGESKTARLLDFFNYCLKYEKDHFDNKYSFRTQMIKTFNKDEHSGKSSYYEVLNTAFKIGLLEKIPEENYNKSIKNFIRSIVYRKNYSNLNNYFKIKASAEGAITRFNVFYVPIWNKDLFKCIDEKLETIAKTNISPSTFAISFRNNDHSYEKYTVNQIVTKEILEKKYILRKTVEDKILEINPNLTKSQLFRFLSKGLPETLTKNNLICKTVTKKDVKKYKIKNCRINNSIIIIPA
jgi:hypothetical protein